MCVCRVDPRPIKLTLFKVIERTDTTAYDNYNFSIIYDYATQFNAENIEYYIVCRKSLMYKVAHLPTAMMGSEWKEWLTQPLPLEDGTTTTISTVDSAATDTPTTTAGGDAATGNRVYRTLSVGKLIYDDEKVTDAKRG